MTTPVNEEQIVETYRDTIVALYRYVSRNSRGDRSLAEDVTQETWLRAVREWRRKGVPEQPIAWLTTVARNLLASYYRTRRPAPLESVSADDVPSAVDDRRAAESSETAAAVCHALARLPDDQAQLLEAFHFEDRRMSQIAESMGVSERAVEGRLRRARQRLRRELEAIRRFVHVVSKASTKAANERASEPTRAERGLGVPARERVRESEGRSPSE